MTIRLRRDEEGGRLAIRGDKGGVAVGLVGWTGDKGWKREWE